MIDIPTCIMIAFVSFILGYAIASLMSVSGRADDRAEQLEQLCALRQSLNVWVIQSRNALARYPDAADGTIVVELLGTAAQCKALLGAFGMVS